MSSKLFITHKLLENFKIKYIFLLRRITFAEVLIDCCILIKNIFGKIHISWIGLCHEFKNYDFWLTIAAFK